MSERDPTNDINADRGPQKHIVFSPQTNDYALESKVISEYDFNNWNGRRAKNVR